MRPCDVAIIGGGIIGGAIAHELARQKLRVVLLDRQQPGREASWAAAGTLVLSPDFPKPIPLVPLAKASYALYPEFVAAIEADSGEKVGLRRGGAIHVFFAPEGDAERDRMIAEHRELGLQAEAISIEEARKKEPALNPALRAAVWLPEESSLEPRRLTDAVLRAAARRGAEIRAGTPVTALALENSRCAGVIACGETISASRVVLAAGCFSGKIAEFERYAPTRPVRGQMVELHSSAAPQRCVLRSARGYVVPRSDGRVVAGSTLEEAGFEKAVTPAGMHHILDAAIELAPSLADAAITETWSGLRPGTPDQLPILGPTDIEGLFIATGHYRNGILLAVVTAKLIREWIVDGRASLPVEQFSPMRFAGEKLHAAH
jgi:glycine oxidase